MARLDAQTKAERCALAECPLAGMGDPRCDGCDGPVSWTDANGRRTGVGDKTHRRCTSCHMNGKGLPVCWAACDGPQTEETTDGQSLVFLGGMPTPDNFIERNAMRWPTSPRGETVTMLSPETEEAVLRLIRILAAMTPADVLVLHALLNEPSESGAARRLGVSKQAVNQAGRRISAKMPELAPFFNPVKAGRTPAGRAAGARNLGKTITNALAELPPI